MKEKILIYGYGNVGYNLKQEFKKLKNQIYIYDKYKEKYSNENILKQKYNFVFICLPTDTKKDLITIKKVIKSIKSEIIIIKSTVPVGFCKKLRNKKVVFLPEFRGTTENNKDFFNFLILGGEEKAKDKVINLYTKIKNGNFNFISVDWKTAELAKFMENSFIALKVTFCNEFADIAKKYNINYNTLRECFIADPRVSPYFTIVYPNQPYYNSHCLNKDIPMLLNQCDKNSINTPLLKKMYKINVYKKQKAGGVK